MSACISAASVDKKQCAFTKWGIHVPSQHVNTHTDNPTNAYRYRASKPQCVWLCKYRQY